MHGVELLQELVAAGIAEHDGTLEQGIAETYKWFLEHKVEVKAA